DYEVANKPGSPYQAMDGHAYDFELLVSDLLRDGENELVIANGQSRETVVMKVRRVAIRYQKAEAAEKKLEISEDVGFISPQVSPPQFSVTVERGGGLTIDFEGQKWQVDSFFSFPNAGWNTLGATDRVLGEETGWRVSKPRSVGGRWILEAEGRSYRIERRVEVRSEIVEVRDTFENITDSDLAVAIRHVVTLPQASIDRLVIGGLEVPVKEGGRWTQANPTTLIVRHGSGLALMPVDDVLRVHAYNFAADGEAGFRDYYFALPPHTRRETKWWIIPVPGGDYFSMVNTIRRAQDTNFRLDGSFAFLTTYKEFTDMSDEELGAWMHRLNLHYVCLSIATPKLESGAYPHGSGLQLVDHAGWRQMLERVKRIRPDTVRLFYYHTYIDAAPDARERFADCRCLKPDGTQFDYNDPRYPLFVPLLDNPYGKAMVKNAETIVGPEIGADGLYWDEMERSAAEYCWGSRWDGCSADIDMKTFTIARKKSSVTLLTMEFRQRIVDWLVAEGRPIVANGNPTTETFTRRYKFPRFVETGSISNLAEAHLYTPIGLADHLTERTHLDTVKAQRRHLMWGCLYYYYHQQATLNVKGPALSKYMWPITPLRLGRGYIVGKERILTAVSGAFGWGEPAQAEVHVIDPSGNEAQAPVRQFDKDGATWWEVKLPPGYMAAIVRK
ncbi:MAG: hypothetical protein H5T86_09520, partial [Armatimonadetes bacterium]|nr:hypothetical protein [Armatimonadota bacterium]